MRRRDDYDDSDCYFCRGQGPGDNYPFYAGFCIDFQQTRSFLSNTIRTRATYRDLKRYHVMVCDDCATRTRQKYHLPGLIGWSLAGGACLVATLVVFLIQAAGDQTIYLMGVLGLFGVLGTLLAGLDAWQLIQGSSSPAVTVKVLEWLKRDSYFKQMGDTFFGPEEYRVLFKDSGGEDLSADELLARDRSASREPKKRKPKSKKKQDSKACPGCGSNIPAYAQACPHCKKILD